jgi:hypothetical protein
VHPGTLFHRRQGGIPMHSYENRSQIRALLRTLSHTLNIFDNDYRALNRARPPRCCRLCGIGLHTSPPQPIAPTRAHRQPVRRWALSDVSEKDAKIAQTSGQLQPFVVVFSQECMGPLPSILGQANTFLTVVGVYELDLHDRAMIKRSTTRRPPSASSSTSPSVGAGRRSAPK